MILRITTATPGDRAAVARLLEAMLDHWGERVKAERLAAGAARLCRGESGTATLLAHIGQRPAGFACLIELFPGSDLAPVLFLKDLFVAPEARGAGIGRALLRATARLAVERGCCRVDWTAADEPKLRRLYEGIGAVRPPAMFYRLHGAALAGLAQLQP